MTDTGVIMEHEEGTDRRLSVHEAVCAERHKSIGERLTRIEKILMGSAGATILLLINSLMGKVS